MGVEVVASGSRGLAPLGLALLLASCEPTAIASSGPAATGNAGAVSIETDRPAALRGTPLSPAEGAQPLTTWTLGSPYPEARERQPLFLYNEVVIDDPDWVLLDLPTAWVDSMQVIKGAVAREIWGPPAASGAVLVFATPPEI